MGWRWHCRLSGLRNPYTIGSTHLRLVHFYSTTCYHGAHAPCSIIPTALLALAYSATALMLFAVSCHLWFLLTLTLTVALDGTPTSPTSRNISARNIPDFSCPNAECVFYFQLVFTTIAPAGHAGSADLWSCRNFLACKTLNCSLIMEGRADSRCRLLCASIKANIA